MKRVWILALCIVFEIIAVFATQIIKVPNIIAGQAINVDINFPEGEDTDGDADFKHIQAAIDSASDGDVVIVMPGNYQEHINFFGKAITVTSTDPDDQAIVAETIIDGDQQTTVVTFNSEEGNSSKLYGFTIQNGKASQGGGIYCSSSSPDIAKCIIKGNSATNQSSTGAGICCQNASPNISECIIMENAATYYSSGTLYGGWGGGIGIFDNSSPTISNCIISLNISSIGGGINIGNGGGSASVTDCTISGNCAIGKGGGIFEYKNSSITHCIIRGNSAIGAGGGIACGKADYTDCIILGNTATKEGSTWVGLGGGIATQSYDRGCNFSDCTISGNFAARCGAGINGGTYKTNTWGFIDITNCIIWYNTAAAGSWQCKGDQQISWLLTFKGSITNSNIQDLQEGSWLDSGGNYSIEPFDPPQPVTIIDHIPLNNHDVPIDTEITITFSQPMDKIVTQAGFSISPSISGTFSWSNGDKTLTFTPISSLSRGQEYIVSITSLEIPKPPYGKKYTVLDTKGNKLDVNGDGLGGQYKSRSSKSKW